MEYKEKAYSTKEVSLTLGIGDSTLRKWCLALEKNGYKFIRNDREQRLFVEGDLVKLRHFQTLVKDHNMQLENASMVVVDRFGKGAFEEGTVSVPAKKQEEDRSLIRSDEVISKLLDHIDQQEKFNKELLDRLDQQQKYIDQRLGERDQKLIESLRQSLLQIAAVQEDKQKGFFARLFGK